jgi:hypothetical protein
VAVRNHRLAALATFAALAVVHTWPLASDPGTLSRVDNADTQLNSWILAWVAHALVTQPLRLFNANIFYPDPLALAYSEHLFVQGVLGAPLAWIGASPVLVFNLLVIGGLALTGWATALILHRWTDDWWAAIAGGSLAAFNTHTLTRMGHVQAMHVEFLPFVLLYLDHLHEDPRPRSALALGVSFALQSLCSVYLMVMTVITVVASSLARAGEWFATARLGRFARNAALAAVVAAALCGPFLWPYAQVRSGQGVTRPMDEIALYSAVADDYLSTAGRLHYALWSHRFYRPADALFPGFAGLLLTAGALVTGLAWRDRRARMLLVTGAAGVALSFGANLPGYGILHTVFPLLQGTRATTRFGYLGLLAVAGLSAFALARLRLRVGPRWRTALGAVALLLVTVEALRAPMGFVEYRGIPQVYDALAREPRGVVVEYPWHSPRFVASNAPYVLASTRHWQPLVNGYSGLVPASYERNNELVRTFPDPDAFDGMRRIGVTHFVVHVDQMPEAVPVLDRRPDVDLVASSRDIRIYRLRP